MKNKVLLSLAVLFTLIISVKADCTDPNDPNCQDTNSVPVSNGTIFYPSNSLLLRVVSIEPLTNGNNGYIAYTNYGWTAPDTNGNIRLSQDAWFSSSSDAETNANWRVKIGVINTFSNYFYQLLITDSIASNSSVLGGFIGTDNSEFVTNVVINSSLSKNFFKVLKKPGFVVYANMGSASGNSSPCPGSYIGYGTYLKPAPDFGFAPDTNNYTVFTATDVLRNDTHIEYGDRFGVTGCANTNSIALASPYNSRYRFTLFFSSNLPTNPYPLYLEGFLP